MEQNSRIINRHPDSPIHIKVVNRQIQREKDELENFFMERNLDNRESSHHAATGKHMRSVFVAAKHHQSQRSHPDVVKLQQMNFGEDSMGSKCASPQAARHGR